MHACIPLLATVQYFVLLPVRSILLRRLLVLLLES